MLHTRFSEFAVFLDDGGVMNDNSIRGLQYQKLVGEYFSPRFGGEPHKWAESNFYFVSEIMKEYSAAIKEGFDIDYTTYHKDFVKKWVEDMFSYVGVEIPSKSEYEKIYRDATEYINPNIRSSFPGAIESIKKLKKMGFMLYTASGEHSLELETYLQGMRVKSLFENFYGPDLINTHKTNEEFYKRIFDDVWFDSDRAIIVEDNPKFLEHALNCGANVIQACFTEEYEPSYPHYVRSMEDLPRVATDIVNSIKK